MPAAPALHRNMRPAQAFVDLATQDLSAVEDGLDLVLRRDQAEDVHALRVALRHLRAVAWAFGPIQPARVKARWKQALRDVADAASDVRDWDVFVTETLAPALADQPGDPVLVALIETVQARRATAREAMVTRLSRYRQAPLPTLHRDLLHLAGRKSRGKLGAFARKRIRKARNRVRALTRTARDGRTDHVHKLRIGNKRLRYAIEALSDVLPKRYRKRLRKQLEARQGELGAVIDASVARRLMAECLGVSTADSITEATANPTPP
ncbi:CHAD domain protein [compost metagenome]|uniref:CHAD domain-containing protein n=1 Tax=Cupriavidus campinensis TaxID=151783 RepID=A0AAE9I2A2_9BURK|nr:MULTISPECIES: CHAD domain-containing protein [Cupriavidus]TSP09585.1 CHAD domain-containing protein [Cupriavidus campinensis]URF04285.1 CHAD domain-containing protein [Cupriavidus campinensis]